MNIGTHKTVRSRRLTLGVWACLISSLIAGLRQAQPESNPPSKTRTSLVSLQCESTVNPLGVDVEQPQLSWILESAERGQRQTAYQIIVSGSIQNLANDHGDLWDSGKVASDQTNRIPCGGKPLMSFQQVFWKVRIWDCDGHVSDWSPPASWTMGVLADKDWRAHWISSQRPPSQSLLLRREFVVRRGLARAVVYVCGLGQYEISLNGRKVGDDLLTPGWTKYDKTCLYDTYDVTVMLRTGLNAVGLVLGNGMYNVQGGRYTKFNGSFGPLKAIAQFRLEYNDGTIDFVVTDMKWRSNPGPISFSCIFGGEDHDARLQPTGWDSPGFDEEKWLPAIETEGPGGKLRGLSCAAPPVRVQETLKPIRMQQLKPGVRVYDLGQNASLIPRIQVKGPAGSVVRIIPAELISADGSVDRISCGGTGSKSYWQYTLAGHGIESWFPKFFYHGSRYLQVECEPGTSGRRPVVRSLEGVVVHSSSPAVGNFACSYDLFNRTHKLVRWAQRSNMMSVLTDCPHREKLGWLEQIHLNGPSLRYEFDLARLYGKSMNDMADSQLENGLVPDIAPEYVVFQEGFRDSPEWGSAFIISAWQQYEWTGDTRLLRKYYEGMKRYVAYLGSRAKDHIVSHGLGDWYDIGPKPPGSAQLTPVALTATAFYYSDAQILSRIASLLGREDDARMYSALAAEIGDAFNRTFYRPQAHQYATGSQCANAMPLVLGLVGEANRAAVLDAIVSDVQNRGNALTAGDVGYRYLLRALADGGRSDVIFDMNSQSDKPGYGYQLKQGATSLPEAWDAGRASSQNHFMLGHIVEWFYHDLAGLGFDPNGPGYKKIVIHPHLVGNLAWARASYNSVQGRIEAGWKRVQNEFRLSITIPANTTATVFVPAKSVAAISESGHRLDEARGVNVLRSEAEYVVLAVESGTYQFVSEFR